MRTVASGLVAAAVAAGLALPVQGAATPPQADSADHRASPAGGNTRDEPAVAVNPRNPRVIVSAANDFDTPGIATYYSSDGGHTWAGTALPPVAGAELGSDPNLAYDSAGRLFAAYVSYTPGEFNGGLTVARSRDGGRTWDTPVVAKVNRSGQSCTMADFPAIAVDTRTSHDTVYAAWQDIRYHGGDCATWESETLELVSSHDHGRTWSRPSVIHDAGGYIPRVTVGGDGTVYVSYAFAASSAGLVDESCPSGWAVQSHVARSADGGRTFRISTAQTTCGPGTDVPVGDPVFGSYAASYTGATYRLPANTNTAVDPRTGVLVNVLGAQDGLDGEQLVRTAYSTDHGRSWHAGGAVSGLPGENQQFPWIAAGANGHLALVYIGQLAGGFLVAEHTTSTDDGHTWTPAVVLSSVPAHVHSAFLLGFIGDYIADAVGSDGLAHPVWTDLRELSPSTATVSNPYVGAPFDGGTIYTKSVAS